MDDGKGRGNHYSPDKQQSKGGFIEFLYNGDTGQILGRTGISWAKIIVFYICFFIGLACFFGLMYFVFYSFLDLDKPRWIGKNGLIGGNPGMGFRPIPDQDKYPESTLIWINADNEMKESIWGNQVASFIKEYKNPKGNGKNCTFENGERANATSYCWLNVTDTSKLGNCTDDKKYGYTGENFSPCAIIKLNKIFDWTPSPYSLNDLGKEAGKESEKRMPKMVQDKINETASGNTIENRKLNTVWISCEGENPGDKESIGQVKYYAPGIGEFPGIPNYYFPYMNQNGYQTPFVFVQFLNLRPNTLIQVECKGWALNIEADRQMRLGSTHFEIMVDRKSTPGGGSQTTTTTTAQPPIALPHSH